MPRDTKKKMAYLTQHLNDSIENDCICISDDEMVVEDGIAEIPVMNDRFETEIRIPTASVPDGNSTESGTQTFAIEWCNIAAHDYTSLKPKTSDKQIQTVQLHDMTTGNGSNDMTIDCGEIVARGVDPIIGFVNTGTQTVAAGSCIIAAHQMFSLSDAKFPAKYTQTEPISPSEERAVKLENELAKAKESLKRLNSRLGDEMIASDSSESSDSSDSSETNRVDDYFSDASEIEKQFDHQFSLKFGFNTNVCALCNNNVEVQFKPN